MVGATAIILMLLMGPAAGMGFFERPEDGKATISVPRVVSQFNSDWRKHKRSIAKVPDHLTIRVNIGSKDVELWVTRSEDNTLNVRQHDLLDHSKDEDFPHQNIELYSNGTSKTVLVVQHSDIDKDHIRVTGSFQHDLDFYHIQPLERSFNISGDFRHIVWTDDIGAFGEGKTSDQVPKIQYRKKRNSGQMRLENTIELFAIVDARDLLEYRSRYQVSEAAAKSLITSSIAYSVESANIRMQSLRNQNSETVVRLCLVGVMILTDPRNSSFTEANAQGNILKEDKAITDFRRFLLDNQQKIPKADHFLVFTAYQFSEHQDLLAKEARVASMCAADSITLIRDKRGGINGRSIAHGLGHSLGARNDEDYNKNSCEAEYTMSRLQTPLNSLANKGHPFLFSSCSADDINTNLARMACTKRVDVPDTKIQPGLRVEANFYNPEQICFDELGRASDFCRDFYSFDFFEDKCFNAICSVGVFCRVPFSNICRGVPALEKMSCGNRKWCIGSQCVTDNNARATNGDDIVAYDKINFPCDARLCPTFKKNLGILYNTNCPLTCPRGTFTCPNVFDIKFPP
ncbi:A disintegrin and metalloproteinase with thrombospondin motifs 1 [Plakobranchus ocellatus]|uniref:A disintegrin and metalloproteinase with thrombospondin motifs 1 n=1 Tax=Plakobranchus ocellatus TaxID=259542 RepID=A0AAV3ZAM3_9GAST|nr:A disintegrin and metalloproteinase with thrombospondin motifs 1 [Plakobranchus ocellatus]